MPVYNGASYIEEAIESILQQTFTDFEFLIIDDGSSDDSADLIASYDDIRIRLLRNQSNLGLVRSLNIGIKQACGKYLARMDADDISLPHRLARQCAFMEQFPEVGVCGAWLEAFEGNTRTLWSPPLEHDRIVSTLLFESVIYHPTVMIRKTVLDCNALCYSIDYPYAEDYELWCRLSRFCRLANIGEVLLHYRLHGNSIGKLQLDGQIRSASRIRQKLLSDFGVVPTDEELVLHTSLSLWQSTVSLKWLQEVQNWLEKLMKSNMKMHVYPEIPLCEVLAKRWHFVCCKASSLGMISYQKYFDSQLSLHNRIAWRHRLGFFIRSILKTG